MRQVLPDVATARVRCASRNLSDKFFFCRSKSKTKMICEVGGSRTLTRLATNTIYVKPNPSEPLNCVSSTTPTKLCAEKGSAANPVYFDQVPGLLGLFPETDLSILIQLGAGEYGSPDQTYLWDRPVQIRGQGMNTTRLLGSHVFQPALSSATGRDSSWWIDKPARCNKRGIGRRQ